jgi:hypothetical protein
MVTLMVGQARETAYGLRTSRVENVRRAPVQTVLGKIMIMET